MNPSEFTLELVHILELLDLPSNYKVVAEKCSNLISRLDELADQLRSANACSMSTESINGSAVDPAEVIYSECLAEFKEIKGPI